MTTAGAAVLPETGKPVNVSVVDPIFVTFPGAIRA
jgi:hypothetical protein